MAFTTDYTNRKVDLLLTDDILGKFSFTFSNQITSGIQKMAQIFTIKMFTITGSKIIDGSSGTTLLENIQNMPANEALVSHYINMAISDTVTQMIEEQADVVYDDEKIKAANLVSVEVVQDKVTATIELESEDRENVNVLLPLSTAII